MEVRVMATIEYNENAVRSLVRVILDGDAAARNGSVSYLRTLSAATQHELGKPVTAKPVKGRVKGIPVEDALAALGVVHGRFLAIVVAEIGDVDPRTRNARSNFARTAASTLRAAYRAGLNPLAVVSTTVTKEWLRTWTEAHREKIAPDAAAGIRRARGLLRRLTELLDALDDRDKRPVLDIVHAEVQTMDATAHYEPAEATAPPRIVSTRLTRRARGAAASPA
jgi:hypothetical protein